MPLSDIVVPERKKGGFSGKVLGAIGGAVGSVVGGPIGGTIGSQVGGLAGGALDPEKTSGPGITRLETKRLIDPQVKLASLVDAKKAAAQLPKDQYEDVTKNYLDPAINHLKGMK